MKGDFDPEKDAMMELRGIYNHLMQGAKDDSDDDFIAADTVTEILDPDKQKIELYPAGFEKYSDDDESEDRPTNTLGNTKEALITIFDSFHVRWILSFFQQ